MTDKNEIKLDSYEQKVSYGFGWQFGRQLHKNNFEGLDINAVMTAIKQCYEGQPSLLNDKELDKAYDMVKDKMKQAKEEQAKNLKELNKQFLEENAKRDGVIVTESGLQYEVLEAGSGAKPSANSVVRTHYHGSFINGQVFDSSVTRNEPAEFALSEVIPGWTEALQMMNVGSKWRIAVPSDIGYGEAGSPPVIPGGSTLIFEISLLDIIE
ncbi:FKBP-type peptidyl-prolyl cis-trans isomerase [Alkalimarinus sediminis]|uniref:Peptidyl-prolyl cis-trans isomerase n=1 Tax=Alkalimarinus sediminis TaxID=1632866 RepID=A0A9E8KJL4_9ALTE|nr:FKBP-type peptidyl-prolyl cis-trans isomerase [Alkalimarinus sediminis]UZW75171.1 FKBP-type peptidyl-prolyl cis-trans isomerase [Alkalimarinus sediminis]